ncbi:MAG: MobV family relaxase [Alistipes sp.]|nr:MobV family relaxase [Alistipes sp.]
MANAKQVMDFRPSKGISTSQSNEHLRRWTEKGWESALKIGNYDPTRERLNFEVVSGGKIRPVDKGHSIPQRMADLLRWRGIKDPNDGLSEPKYRTVVNFIFGGSRERMQELAFGSQAVNFDKGADNSAVVRKPDIEQWAKDVYTFVSGKYGEENIAAFIVHLDELNPHIHCTLLPIKDGKFAYKDIFAGKDKYEYSARMKQLHSDFAEVNSRWGMSRGRSVSETGAKHRTTEEYRRHLSEECTNIEQQIGQHRKALSSLQTDIRLAERRVKGLTTMVENLRNEKTEKEAQIVAAERELAAHDGNAQELADRIARLQAELGGIEAKLADKNGKLQEADRQLAALKEDMDAIERRTEELRAEAYKYSGDVQSKVDTLLRDVLLEDVVSEYRDLSARMDETERQLFDDTLLRSIAEQGQDVMHCATMLFLGMVDDATTFAETRGGGGGGKKSGWGRDDDEDNRAWARRCMRMARRMMRPATGKKPKR